MTPETFHRAQELVKTGSLIIPPEPPPEEGLWLPPPKPTLAQEEAAWLGFPTRTDPTMPKVDFRFGFSNR